MVQDINVGNPIVKTTLTITLRLTKRELEVFEGMAARANRSLPNMLSCFVKNAVGLEMETNRCKAIGDEFICGG